VILLLINDALDQRNEKYEAKNQFNLESFVRHGCSSKNAFYAILHNNTILLYTYIYNIFIETE